MTVNNTQSVFAIHLTFPKAGSWSFSFEFMYDDRIHDKLREGVSLIDLVVYGTPQQTPETTTFNYTTTNSFRTYPVNSSEIFTDWVDVSTNLDNSMNGFTAVLTIDGQSAANVNGLPPNLGTNIKVMTDRCSTMYIDFFDSEGNPAKIVPYLSAAAHFTISNRDNAVYHAHGMYRPSDLSMQDVVTALNGQTMLNLHQLNPETNPLYNLSMNAMMIGVETNGSVNCFSDAGTVMQSMQGMMNMSSWYGPEYYSSIMGLFNFPDVDHFTIFVYVKVQLSDGSNRLIIPSFAISAYLEDTSDDNNNNDNDDESSNNGNSFIQNIPIAFLFLLICSIF